MSNSHPCNILTNGVFNALSANPNGQYTYDMLCQAITNWNEFRDEDDQVFLGLGEQDPRFEIAAFLGNVLHGTGDLAHPREVSQCGTTANADGSSPWTGEVGNGTLTPLYCRPNGYNPDPPGEADYADPYCSASHSDMTNPPGCNCADVPELLGAGYDASKLFFGRGPIQLSWNYNYLAAGEELSVDLCAAPDLVATEPNVAWGTALWFWSQNGGASGTTPHEAVTTSLSFGQALNTINGGIECVSTTDALFKAKVVSRLDNYCKATFLLGLNTLLSLDGCTDLQAVFDSCIAGGSGQWGTCPNCDFTQTLGPTPPPLTRSHTPPPLTRSHTPVPCGGFGSGACTINGDPHFNPWDMGDHEPRQRRTSTILDGGLSQGVWYDFQGGCDMIAIDNPVLQVQIRTRPVGNYSIITQLAVEIKETGEFFRVRSSGTPPVESTIGNSGAGPAKHSWENSTYPPRTGKDTGITHTIRLGNEYPPGHPDESYIRILLRPYGITMTANGCPQYFTGSQGMCGSWDSNGVRLRNNDPFDVSGGFASRDRTIALASDWQIASGSRLWDPSNVCDPSPQCGPGEVFECAEGQPLQQVIPGCNRTCADIGIQQFREQCETDIMITGDPTWACTEAYVNPVVSTGRVGPGVPGGCYETYVDGNSYVIGDLVSATVVTTSNPIYTMDPITGAWLTEIPTTETTRNYKCISNSWCGTSGYGPGSTGESLAWEEGIECSGIAIPVAAFTPPLWNAQGGCPKTYEAGTIYDAGDVASVDNLVYQCAAEPTNLFCGQTGFAPGADQYWEVAWALLGSCSGTLTPTSSPNYVALIDLGGCPKEWVASTPGGVSYEEGDTVSSTGLVFSCKAWPFNLHCGQQGYEPLTNPATPGAWKDAWEVVGYCDGSRPPTSSPNFVPATFVGGCPEEWSAGSNVKYEEGDMVSSTVSTVPLRKVAFRCKAWPLSGHCGQFSPTNELGGSLGWSLVGSCDGSIEPTASPSFDELAFTASGCPAEYSASSTNYAAGDLVTQTVSTTPERKIVFACRKYPNTGFCNQSGFRPGSKHAHMAWTLIGACSGTLNPSASPVAYAGTCTYNKCVEVDDTEPCTPGSTGCSCGASDAAGPSCKRAIKHEDCSDVDVNRWSNSVDYTEGDVVRIGTKRFRCREWPFKLWCKVEAYMPMLEPGIWSQAWLEDGTCM